MKTLTFSVEHMLPKADVKIEDFPGIESGLKNMKVEEII